jgi:anthranilate synthase/aminodeoxychorismate synthase-like glutamine amidotransferase
MAGAAGGGRRTVILLVDNRDSFVYNLARYVRELEGDAIVRRSDALALGEVDAMAPSHIIVSPGPCTPAEAGISVDLVRHVAGRIPLLGVCLGHQCIGAAFGAAVVRARRPVHGMTARILHDGAGVLRDIPSPFLAARYHSLILDEATLGPDVIVTARLEDGTIMGIRHRRHQVFGVQFHPESVLTDHGHRILANFLGIDLARVPRAHRERAGSAVLQAAT